MLNYIFKICVRLSCKVSNCNIFQDKRPYKLCLKDLRKEEIFIYLNNIINGRKILFNLAYKYFNVKYAM
jgi:hypothetical protein